MFLVQFRLRQSIHAGMDVRHDRANDGAGEAWCRPTRRTSRWRWGRVLRLRFFHPLLRQQFLSPDNNPSDITPGNDYKSWQSKWELAYSLRQMIKREKLIIRHQWDVAMLSKGRQHWFQPAAQDNIADFTLAVVLRHGHYIKWPVIFYCQIHATETFVLLVTFVFNCQNCLTYFET